MRGVRSAQAAADGAQGRRKLPQAVERPLQVLAALRLVHVGCSRPFPWCIRASQKGVLWNNVCQLLLLSFSALHTVLLRKSWFRKCLANSIGLDSNTSGRLCDTAGAAKQQID